MRGFGQKKMMQEQKQTKMMRAGLACRLELELEWEQLETKYRSEQKQLAEITADRDALDSELKAYTSQVVRIETALDDIAPDDWLKKYKRKFMELPIIDGFNGHQRVIQDWLPELKITLGMSKTARFDRCRTCHLGIDKFGIVFDQLVKEQETPLADSFWH